MKIISIIPARGGSKGIPKKNIQPFLDQPLITHSINYSTMSKKVMDTYVSTDDHKIMEIAEQSGANIIKRPQNISGDTATTESAIKHVLSTITIIPDIIILLQPTSPFRPPNSLDNAINHFIDNKYDSLLSISPTHNFIWNISKDIAIPKYDFINRPRRQDILKENINYIENGSLYIFTNNHFNKTNNRLGGKIGYVIFDEKYANEIDTELDLIILEQINKRFNS